MISAERLLMESELSKQPEASERSLKMMNRITGPPRRVNKYNNYNNNTSGAGMNTSA